MTQINPCPICNSQKPWIFIDIDQMPVYCNRLYTNFESAVNTARGNIRLAFCDQCGHIFNAAFDPARMEYGQDYENSLHFSPRFQAYADSLAGQLIDRYDLHHKKIIEIGSGQGDFLSLLCMLGDNHGIGFDPSYNGLKNASNGSAIEYIQDYYSAKYADLQADLICCRQTLEHLYKPVEFIAGLRQSIDKHPDTILFFEVPNANFLLHGLSIWDVIYEHYSIFSRQSLNYLFKNNGFHTLRLEDAFEGQYLTIDAAANAGNFLINTDIQPLRADVENFKKNFDQKVSYWKKRLSQIEAEGKCAVVWGAGSKGVTFLNVLNQSTAIRNVVDINPRKKNMYVAGSGHQIISPADLQSLHPDVVLVMNPIYLGEIRQELSELGIGPEMVVIHE